MKIVCPHCNFTREMPDAQVPERPVKVTCPQCRQGFPFDKRTAAGSAAEEPGMPSASGAAAPAASPEARTTCPACGLEQAAGDACQGCGLNYAKWAARQESRDYPASPPPPAPPFPERAAYLYDTPAGLPKAGFWIRLAASLLDTVILVAVQFAIEAALNLIGGNLDEIALSLIAGLCSMVISLTYYIFFTGYNGQTPGKMALRIQVVRTDGTPMTYGRAFLREVLGKFVSGIVLGIGYLVVAFDRDKQGWHDKIAKTYVIRL
jgi:uncharacterized RDD family membrane protein YckC